MNRKSKKRKSLIVNASLNGLQSVLNLIFPLITFPYISRILSVEGMGIYNFSNTYVGYFGMISSLGIATYAVREGAKYRNDKKEISNFSSQIFTINIVSTLVAYICLFLSLIIFKNLTNYVSCILIFSLQILFNTLGINWIYTIYEDYSYITIRNILFKIISIILLFILVKKPTGYLVYAGITVFANVGSNILNFLHSKSLVNIKLVRKPKWKLHFSPIMVIFASTLAVNLYVFSDNLILGILKNDYAVGIYGVSVKIYTVAQGLLTAVLTVTIPRLAMLFGKKMKKEYHKVLSQVIDTLIVFSLPTAIGLMMMSKEVVLIIAGKKYLPSVTSLQIMSLAIVFSIFSWIFSDCVLIPAKREKLLLHGTIVTAIFNIVLNFCLIPFWSYNAAALTTVLSEFLAMILNGYYSRDIVIEIIRSKVTIRNFWSAIVGCVGIIFICILCRWSFQNVFVNTIMSIGLSVSMYIAILVLGKNTVLKYFLQKIKERCGKVR